MTFKDENKVEKQISLKKLLIIIITDNDNKGGCHARFTEVRYELLYKKPDFNASAQWQLSRTKHRNKRKVYYLETDKYDCLYILTESRLENRAMTGVAKKIRSLK